MIRANCFAIVALSILTGCNSAKDEAIGACEIFVKERLRSPSTYKQISVDFSGVIFKSDGRDVKLVGIEYDAANAYGTPIRGKQQCIFEVDKKGKYLDDPAHAAKMSAIGADEYAPCCLLEKDKKLSEQGTGGAVISSTTVADAAERAADEAIAAADAMASGAAAAAAVVAEDENEVEDHPPVINDEPSAAENATDESELTDSEGL